MRLSIALIEELVKEVAGEDTLVLVRLILGKENVSEFKIAEKLNITVNQVRNMLYRLNEHDLVSFTRKKDKEKGWYIYFWTFDIPKARHLIIERKQRKIADLKKTIAEETTTAFFVCPNKCVRIPTEQALELEYKCPICGALLKEEDTKQLIEKAKEKIEKLRAELNEALASEEEKKEEAPQHKKQFKKKPEQKQPQKKKLISQKKRFIHHKKSIPKESGKKKHFKFVKRKR